MRFREERNLIIRRLIMRLENEVREERNLNLLPRSGVILELPTQSG